MSSNTMNNYPALLPQVTDESLFQKVQTLVNPILTNNLNISLDWLEDRGWIA